MTKNNKNVRSVKSPQASLIEQVKKEIFDTDNSQYREVVDTLMDSTGETAAEIASALVGMLLKNKRPVSPNPKKAPAKTKKSVDAKKETAFKHKVPKNTASPKTAKAPAKKQSTASVQLTINAGENKKITHKDIMGALIAKTGITATDINKIKVGEKQSVVHVPQQHAKKILSAMNAPDGKIKGIPVKVNTVNKRKKATKNALEK